MTDECYGVGSGLKRRKMMLEAKGSRLVQVDGSLQGYRGIHNISNVGQYNLSLDVFGMQPPSLEEDIEDEEDT